MNEATRNGRGRRFISSVAAVLVVAATFGAAQPAHADYVRDLEYWLDDYGIREAWQTTRGAGQRIAVIDTGVADVSELAGAVVGGTDVSGIGSPDGREPVGEESSHGTLVGTILAARGDGGDAGVIGVAPEAELLSISVAFGDAAAASTDDQIANAVRWAVDNGATVINMSLTTNTLTWPESWDDAFLYAFENDVVVIAAAGNRGAGTVEVGAPATIPGVVAVAGVDRAGDASFDASSQGITLAVAAPSEELVGVTPSGDPVLWSGTSGAAPIVAGVVALIRSAHPDLDADSVIERLIRTAKPKGDPVPGPIYGYGLVDAAAAVTADVAPVDSNPLAVPYDLAEWIRLYRRSDAPTPQPTAEQSAPPVAAPKGPADPYGFIPVWLRQALPTTGFLPGVLLPVSVFAVFGALLALTVAGTVRAARRAQRK
ncbi:S8 family serine peptidase [Herbiconiux sp. L3-i23]|uniref:S8 family serine peptidase n=1 Tax=Herbiconiux sp. L3-i23 TaxID=2905871 RepID=UPI00207400BB|nr:S8 family serine peptidase [Herbiconiux sp. L3-i23]